MGDAVLMGKAAHNPVSVIKAPSKSKAKMDDALSLKEAKAFLAAVKGERLEALVTVALGVGLRKGEALALRWPSVDLDVGTLKIEATLKWRTWRHGCEGTCGRKRGADCPQRHGGGIKIDTPKTEAGARTIPLPKISVDALREHRSRQRAERGAEDGVVVPLLSGDDYVFTMEDGRPITPRHMTTLYHRMLKKAKLPQGRFHALRHSAASLMLAQGVPLEVVSEILGHAGYAITKDVYGHLTQEVLRKGADAMDGALGG